MARIYVSGINDQALEILTTSTREVISNLNPDGDGRIFYLTHISITNEHATEGCAVELFDIDEAAAGLDATTHRATSIQIGPNATTHVEFADGTMPFVTNCVAGKTVAVGTVAITGIHASGYLA